MSEKLQSFTAKVYAVMGGALLLTGATAWVTSSIPALFQLAINPIAAIVVAIIDVVLAIWLTRSWEKLSFETALGGLAVYSILDGFILSYIFIVYDLGSVFTVFALCSVFFFLLALMGKATKIDLSKFSTVFLVGLIAIVIAGVVNVFLQNDTLALITSVVGVILFMGLTLYDTQKIQQIAESSGGDDKMVVPMALQVYLDFINLFLRLLELFGRRRD